MLLAGCAILAYLLFAGIIWRRLKYAPARHPPKGSTRQPGNLEHAKVTPQHPAPVAEGITAPHKAPAAQALPLTMMDRNLRLPDGQSAAATAAADETAASEALDEAMPPSMAEAPPVPVSQTLLDDRSLQPPVSDDPGAVCARLLERAQLELQDNQASKAAATLRDTIRLAASNGLNEVHAAARLELGELARHNGDLITACEHWQIARGLYHDMKNSPRVKTTEARMRAHGCPTDWVLTDF